MWSSVTQTGRRSALQDSCLTFDLAVACSATEGTAKCTVLDAIETEWKYQRKIIGPVLKFLVHFSKGLLSSYPYNLSYTVCPIWCKGFQVVHKVLRLWRFLSTSREDGYCTQWLPERIGKSSRRFKSRWLHSGPAKLFKVHQSQIKLKRRADGFLFQANCCDQRRSWHVYATMLPFFKSIYSSMRQKVLTSSERSSALNDYHAEGPKYFVLYY